MKKLILLGLVTVFTLSFSTAAFAFGDCEGKIQKTKVADVVKKKIAETGS